METERMDVMELVKNESNARSFQCDWISCNKGFNRKSDLQRHYRIHINERPFSCMTQGCGKSFIQRSALTVHIRTHTGEKPCQCMHIGCGKRFSDCSSLARHRRTHTRTRPYRCVHDDCLKSFCRKATMVKHHRRSHQWRIHPSELGDGETSDSDSGESPSISQHSSRVQWPQTVNLPGHSVMTHGHQMYRAHSFADFGQHQLDGYSVQQQYGHRHSLPGGTQNFNQSIPEYNLPNPTMQQRAPSLPAHSSYHVPEPNKTGVAILNTDPTPIQIHNLPRHQHSQEMLPNSPSTYSSASRASPVSTDQYYAHQPVQNATYALQNTSPVEQQPMVHYQQQLPQHISQPQPMPTPIPQVIQVYEQYCPSSQQNAQWYDSISYQGPEVASHSQAYPQQHIFQDPWRVQMIDDSFLQMPSAWFENL